MAVAAGLAVQRRAALRGEAVEEAVQRPVVDLHRVGAAPGVEHPGLAAELHHLDELDQVHRAGLDEVLEQAAVGVGVLGALAELLLGVGVVLHQVEQVAVVAPLAVGLDPVEQDLCRRVALDDLEVVVAHLLVEVQVLGPDPVGAQVVDRLAQPQLVADQRAVVQREALAAAARGGGERHGVVAGDGAVLAAPVVDDQLQLDLARGLLHRPQHVELAVDADLVDHDAVGAVVDPEAHLSRRVGEAVGADAHPQPRVALLDQAQEEGVGHGDGVDADAVDPLQQLLHLALPLAGELGVLHRRGVEEVVEADALGVGPLHVAGQARAVHLGQVEGGAAAAEVVGGQLAVDLVDRVGRQAIQQFVVEVAGY